MLCDGCHIGFQFEEKNTNTTKNHSDHVIIHLHFEFNQLNSFWFFKTLPTLGTVARNDAQTFQETVSYLNFLVGFVFSKAKILPCFCALDFSLFFVMYPDLVLIIPVLVFNLQRIDNSLTLTIVPCCDNECVACMRAQN